MAFPSTPTIVFNASGAALVIFLGGYMVTSLFTTERIEACTARYPAGQQFSLGKSSGIALSPIELQGRAGFREHGLLANASVEKSSGVAWDNSLVVSMAATKNEQAPAQNGVGFVWPVPALKSARSACLSYFVYLSKDVDLKSPGRLPGLLAERATGPDGAGKNGGGFVARMAWQQTGGVGVDVASSGEGGSWLPSLSGVKWPLQKWVRVEQEVVLNPAAKKSGVVRVWINGRLDIENSGLALRSSPDVLFAGVAGDIGYSRGLGKVAAVKVSPFVVQWR